ncbi:hypothetical protein VFPPC_03269 [Pochonia chlamydosporia 170]|uniref:Uncharacterized protein n=1 Tax=Pochonia chlamydosporia 170 TaxID=1380566 RepID=A0A179G079_METCM|nr:hypothetical protein VFPPC_03269 [Pochonia chlamydosporia 170]OAQ70878.1 hypothetical protein VFPPC_03269 [Pochonia chlamydosporia 170]
MPTKDPCPVRIVCTYCTYAPDTGYGLSEARTQVKGTWTWRDWHQRVGLGFRNSRGFGVIRRVNTVGDGLCANPSSRYKTTSRTISNIHCVQEAETNNSKKTLIRNDVPMTCP